LFVAFVAAALLAIFLAALHHDLDVHAPSHLVLDRHGAYLAEFPAADGELGYWPLPDVLPEKLVTATLEIEDRAFYRHAGVRVGSLLRAAWQNLAARRVVSGASTVAMQLARLQSPGPRNLWRKAREAAEALWLVRAHGHDRVLRQYLTLAPYGNNVRGAARAARLYFGKPVGDLSWLEAAFLASLPQAPALMNPYDPAGHRRARARADRILRVLHERHLVSDVELAQALAGTLTLVPRPHRSPMALHAALAWQTEATQRGPISTTTLDLGLQEQTARLVDENLRRLTGTNADNTAALVVALPGQPGAWGMATSSTAAGNPASDAAANGAPGGEILAYVGSADYGAEDAKGAIDYLVTKRSPGSALKPFIYGLALAGEGRARTAATTATVLADTPTQIPLGFSQQWFPENFDRTFEGPVLLRHALGNSRNVPALEILARVGVDETLQLLDHAGVRGISYAPGRYGLALAIGALPVTALEMARLYGLIATGGEAFPLRKFVDERPSAGARLLSRESAALLADVLADPLARRPAFPAGGPLDFPYAVAVKTGTSQGNRDAWAVGFSDRVLVVVWVGNHDGRRMDRVTGASGAGPAFHAIMDAATAVVAPHIPPAAAFSLPSGLARTTVCSLSGHLAGPHCPTAHQEVFIKGTEPTTLCPFHHEVTIDCRNHLRAGPQCPSRFVDRRVMLDLPATYAAWARERHLDVAPLTPSPLCGAAAGDEVIRVSIVEPRPGTRLLYDPDAAPESAGVKLEASVQPSGEEVVWDVDGVPIARVGPPYIVRQTLTPGKHTVVARLARLSEASRPVIVDILN
jgi:penicillin-binding protein 1C